MALAEEIEANGNWLFRWRSYLPLVLLAAVVALVPFKGEPGEETAIPPNEGWEWFCLAVSAMGLIIRAATIGSAPKGTSGRNTGRQVAHEVNRTGPYSVVRHPLYLGNFFAYLGIVLYVEHVWFALVFLLVFWLYYERIMYAEEAFLRNRYGEDYLEWARETPAFIPRPSRWRKAGLPFSLATVVAEEYGSIFAVIASFGLLRWVESRFLATDPFMDILWAGVFFSGLAFYLIVRVLKKSGRFAAASRR